MTKVLRWIVLVWAILAVPYTFEAVDISTWFFEVLFLGLIIAIMIIDLKNK